MDLDPNRSNSRDFPASLPTRSRAKRLRKSPEEPYYLEKAQEFLTALYQPTYYEPDADDGWQSVLRRVTSEYDAPETGSIFGDYYLLETMVRECSSSTDESPRIWRCSWSGYSGECGPTNVVRSHVAWPRLRSAWNGSRRSTLVDSFGVMRKSCGHAAAT